MWRSSSSSEKFIQYLSAILPYTSAMDTENKIHEIFPYLRVKGAAAAIEFYKQAFGAIEVMRLAEPSGRIGHAEVRIGPMVVMLADEFPEMGIVGPQTLGGTTFSLHLHVDNCDSL